MKNNATQTVLYSVAGVVAMALILVAFNIVSGAFKVRVDLTEEKAYTLSDGTRVILGNLEGPIKVRYYCTEPESASRETVFMRSHAKLVEDLLDEFKQAGGGNVIIEKYNPQPDSDAEDSARLDGIQGQLLPNGDPFYLGLTVSQLDQKETIPFLTPARERQLEYDMARAIARVANPTRPVIGVMSALPVWRSGYAVGNVNQANLIIQDDDTLWSGNFQENGNPVRFSLKLLDGAQAVFPLTWSATATAFFRKANLPPRSTGRTPRFLGPSVLCRCLRIRACSIQRRYSV